MYETIKKHCDTELTVNGNIYNEQKKQIRHLWQLLKGKKKEEVRMESGEILNKAADNRLLRPVTIAWLTHRGVDLNRTLPNGLRFADKLAAQNTLTPQLIGCLAEKGYDFQAVNRENRNIAHYMTASDLLIKALKAEDFDFFQKSQITLVSLDDNSYISMWEDSAAETLVKRAKDSMPVFSLFNTRDEWLTDKNHPNLKETIFKRINNLKPEKQPTCDYIVFMKHTLLQMHLSDCCKRAYQQEALHKMAPHGLKENHPFWERMKQENQNKR